MTIAIQGIIGSYHHEVADLLYKNCKITAFTNFSEIQTHPENYTRFVILSSGKSNEVVSFTKTSMKFFLSHKVGSLSEVLNIIKNNNLSISKLQSLPILDKPWEYAFFIDILVDDIHQYNKAENEISQVVNKLKILGKYNTEFSKKG